MNIQCDLKALAGILGEGGKLSKLVSAQAIGFAVKGNRAVCSTPTGDACKTVTAGVAGSPVIQDHRLARSDPGYSACGNTTIRLANVFANRDVVIVTAK